MMDEFECEGWWWLPNNEENKVAGILKFTSEEFPKLSLNGTLSTTRNGNLFNRLFDIDIILGICLKGPSKKVTLEGCKSYSIGGLLDHNLFKEQFIVNTVFVGEHFKCKDDIKFNKLSSHYLYLDEWLDISKTYIKLDKKNFGKVEISHEIPDTIKIDTGEDNNLFFEFESIRSLFNHIYYGINIKQKAYVGIETSEEKPLGKLLKTMRNIQDFLSLAILEPIYPITIQATKNQNLINIYMMPNYPYIFKNKRKHSHEMFFTYKDIEKNFKLYINKWLEKAELLEPLYNLYFAAWYNPRMYLEKKFLNLIQAIEYYNRSVEKKYIIAKKECRKIANNCLKEVPQEHSKLKKRFRELLFYGYEPSLHDRLDDIIKKYSDFFDEYRHGNKAIDAFIEDIVKARNYYIHYDLKTKEKPPNVEELIKWTSKLRKLTTICLLDEIGLINEPRVVSQIIASKKLEKI